jgi:D-alanyl-D-alanine carboxypeptidase
MSRPWWARLAIVAIALAVVGIGAASGGVRALAPAMTASPFDGPLAACRIDDRLTPHRGEDDWARTFLDQGYTLDAEYVPSDLVDLESQGIDGVGSLRRFVVDDLAAMADDARGDGAPFRVTSAYRSYAQQVRTFASLEETLGRDEALRSAARPGHSEHQLGTTIDVAGGERWLASHAWRYGFALSYPPKLSPQTTCYKPEPWHFRYIGRDAARELRDSGLSLRAWLWERQAGD